MPKWYAAQTKPHKEFMVRDVLAHTENVEVFLPVLHVNPVNPRARKIRPFFPGYLFLRADLEQVGISAIQWTPGLVRVLGAEDQPQPIPDRVIQEIRFRVGEVQEDEAHAGGRFRKGDLVRITSGPFDGFEGMFDTRLGGKTRARILIEFLGRLTATEVDVRNLEEVSRRGT
jgi:transcription antitermination factor NusG